jgi:CPA2 family monovalent cation:H+ antiporter-2
VEDFLAVAMMTVLAGIGDTGEISITDVGQLGLRLVLFTVVSLALGIRLFPKFIDLVAKMGSKEVLVVLVTGSAFAMAIFADSLGLSIAAGAFIIGAVTAEARNAVQVHHLSEPIRDIFGALFFVTMGMLVDLQVLREYIVPVILILLVVILGKIASCYLGVFLSGYRKRTALQVGVGMSQTGEFSMVIAKIGTETGATGAFLQPLMAVVSGITALTTPYLIRSGDRLYRLLSRVIPPVVKRRSDEVEFWTTRVRATLAEDTPVARNAKNSLIAIAVNVILIGAMLFGAERAISLIDDSNLGWLGFLIGGGALLLCAPSIFAIWRALRSFFESMLERLTQRGSSSSFLRRRRLMDTLPLATATIVVIIIIFEAIPLMLQLLSLTRPIYLLPFGVAGLILLWLTWESLGRFHKRLEELVALQPVRREEQGPSEVKPDVTT